MLWFYTIFSILILMHWTPAADNKLLFLIGSDLSDLQPADNKSDLYLDVILLYMLSTGDFPLWQISLTSQTYCEF